MKKILAALTVLLTLAPCLLTGCSPDNSDPGFARRGVELLLAGDPSAEAMIDWDYYQALGSDYGSSYRLLATEDAKKVFRANGVAATAAAFQAMNAGSGTFGNWQIRSQDASGAIVVADTRHEGKLLVVVNRRTGQQKITSVSIGS